MKTVKQLSILTSLAAVSLLSGCDIAEDTCTTDADCAEGETCQIAEGSADENICVAGEGSATGSSTSAPNTPSAIEIIQAMS
jgi:Cys-rich repeat protein